MSKFFVALVICLLTSRGFAGTFYVSPNGSDSGTGSSSSPWKTISKAGATVPAGSTVYVAAGSYGVTTIQVSGTSSARTRFISQQKWGAKIVASGSSTNYAVRIQGSYVDFEGFDVTGGASSSSTFNGIAIDGKNGAGSTYVKVKKNRVHDITPPCGTGAVGINDLYYYLASDGNAKSRYNEIEENLIFNIHEPSACSTRKGVGIYVSTYKTRIQNNLILSTHEYGIHLWHGANAATIVNNTIAHIGVSGSGKGVGIEVGAGDAPTGVVDDYTTVNNNLVAYPAVYGLQEFCYSGSNCTGTHNTFTKNLVYAAGSKSTSLRHGVLSGLVTSSPQFVNDTATSSGDYHVQSASPAINGGTTSSAPSIDFDLGLRNQSTTDIGAYEFSSTPGSYPY